MMLSTLKKALAVIESQLDGEDVDVCLAETEVNPTSITGGQLYTHKKDPSKRIVVLW